jgi:hypothetical protein
MGLLAWIGNALAWSVLLPGNVVCNAVGVGQSDNRELVRMLVTSLVWTAVGVLVVALVA